MVGPSDLVAEDSELLGDFNQHWKPSVWKGPAINIIYLKRNYFNMTEMNDNPEMLLPLLILFFFSCTVRTQDEFGCSPVEGCRSNYPGVVRIVTKP